MNEAIKETEKQISSNIEMYLDRKERINKINDIICPEFPKKPVACNLEELEEYRKKKIEYDKVVYLKGEEKEKLKKELESLKKEIIRLLPISNTWILLNENSIAVAHRTDDWPSSLGDLLIVNNPNISELNEIRHQIIN